MYCNEAILPRYLVVYKHAHIDVSGSSWDHVDSVLTRAGLSDLIDVFDDLGIDDVEMIKENFSDVLRELEQQGTRLTTAQQQVLREKLGLVSVEVASCRRSVSSNMMLTGSMKTALLISRLHRCTG